MADTDILSQTKQAMLGRYLREGSRQAALDAGIRMSPGHQEAKTRRERIVAVQRGGSTSTSPLFFLHGQWDGSGYYCFPLSRGLGSDQPFYAVEPYTFDGLPVPPTIEAMAAAHLESLRAQQPSGPYQLAGYCNGALVAYEMAWQLYQQGQIVDPLILIDPMAPGDFRLLRKSLQHLGDLYLRARDYVVFGMVATSAVTHLGDLMRVTQETQLNSLLWCLHQYASVRDAYRRVRDAYFTRSRHSVRVAARDPAGPKRRLVAVRSLLAKRALLCPSVETLRQNWEGIFIWTTARYAPEPYPGPITFVWNGHEPTRSYRRVAWNHLLEDKQGVQVHIIPGSHADLRNEHVGALARCLRLCLDNVT
jgi:thioesterase domain-containing protein